MQVVSKKIFVVNEKFYHIDECGYNDLKKAAEVLLLDREFVDTKHGNDLFNCIYLPLPDDQKVLQMKEMFEFYIQEELRKLLTEKLDPISHSLPLLNLQDHTIQSSYSCQLPNESFVEYLEKNQGGFDLIDISRMLDILDKCKKEIIKCKDGGECNIVSNDLIDQLENIL